MPKWAAKSSIWCCASPPVSAPPANAWATRSLSPGASARCFETLKARWAFRGHVERALHGNAGASQRTFVKQPPDERDTVRNAAWWRELRERMRRVRRPVAPCLGDMHETSPEGE